MIIRVQARSRGGRWAGHTKKLGFHLRIRRDQEQGGGAGPSRAQKRSRAGRWSGLRKLDFFCFSCSSTAVLRTQTPSIGLRYPSFKVPESDARSVLRTLSLWLCSAQQLTQQLSGTLVATQWRGPHCLNIFVVLAVVYGLLGLLGRSARSSLHFFIPHSVIQLTTVSFWVPETRLRLPQVNK